MSYNPQNPNGQKTGANSSPVVIASDNLVAVTLSGNTAVTISNLDVALSTRTKPSDQQHTIIDSAAIPLNVQLSGGTNGLALEAGHLATIDTKTPSLGQATKANSSPVTQASDQIVSILTGQAAQTAVVNNILPAAVSANATDVSQYRSFAIQVVSTGTGGTFIFEGSNDNVSFQAIPIFSQAAPPITPIVAAITATNSSFIYIGSIQFQYIRLRIATTITGGSIQAFSLFNFNSFSPTITSVAANTNNLSVTPGASAALAEGTANPNAGMIRSFPLLFNLTTWDRQHGNYNTTTTDTGAKVAAGNGVTQTNFDSKGATITLQLGTVSGTFTTFQLQLQFSPDAGTTWYNYGAATTNDTSPITGDKYIFQVYPGVSALTSGGKQTISISGVLPRTWRFTWNIVGSSPSTAFTAVYVNYNL